MEGQRVLIVEDCYLMADTLQDILTAAGATVVGAANSVGTALRMIEALQIDMACHDANLGCENSFPLGDKLTFRGIPFVFVTAYDANMLPPIHCARPLVSKPVDSFRIGAGLRNGFQPQRKVPASQFCKSLKTRTPGTVCLLIDPAFQGEEAAELLRA